MDRREFLSWVQGGLAGAAAATLLLARRDRAGGRARRGETAVSALSRPRPPARFTSACAGR